VKDERRAQNDFSSQKQLPDVAKAAEVYHWLQFCVIPVQRGDKKPAISGWDDKTFSDYPNLRHHFAKGCQVAIVTGETVSPVGSDGRVTPAILDIDIDKVSRDNPNAKAVLEKAFVEICKLLDEAGLGEGVKVQTGSGRWHIPLLIQASEITEPVGKLILSKTYPEGVTVNIEFRFRKCYHLAPPSLHPDAFRDGELVNPQAVYKYILGDDEIDRETGLPKSWRQVADEVREFAESNGLDAASLPLDLKAKIYEAVKAYFPEAPFKDVVEILTKWSGKNLGKDPIPKTTLPTPPELVLCSQKTPQKLMEEFESKTPRDEVEKQFVEDVANIFCDVWNEGIRHELALRISGELWRQGIEPHIIYHIMRRIAELKGDKELSDRLRVAVDTVVKPPSKVGSKGGIYNILLTYYPKETATQVVRNFLNKIVEFQRQKGLPSFIIDGIDIRDMIVTGDVWGDEMSEPDWVVPNLVAMGKVTLIFGKPKVGKTTFATYLAICIHNGIPFLGLSAAKKQTLYVALDHPDTDVRGRLLRGSKALGVECPLVVAKDHLKNFRVNKLHIIRRAIEYYGCEVVFIDNYGKFARPALRGKQGMVQYEVADEVWEEICYFADELGIALVLTHHERKPRKDADDDDLDQALGSVSVTGNPEIVIRIVREKGSDTIHAVCKGNLIKNPEGIHLYYCINDDYTLSLKSQTSHKLSPNIIPLVVKTLSENNSEGCKYAVIVHEVIETFGFSEAHAKRLVTVALDNLTTSGFVSPTDKPKSKNNRWKLTSEGNQLAESLISGLRVCGNCQGVVIADNGKYQCECGSSVLDVCDNPKCGLEPLIALSEFSAVCPRCLKRKAIYRKPSSNGDEKEYDHEEFPQIL